jgi:hypothetical protein
MEEWKAIPGYEGYYEISTLGNVRSVERSVHGKGGRTDIRRAQDKKTFVLKNSGYVVVLLSKNGKNKTYYVHRLVAQTFIPNDDPDGKPEIDHIDRVQANNVVYNLRWVNRKANLLNRAPFEQPLGMTGERYIILTKQNNYQVRISGHCVGTFVTLEEAVTARDNFLQNGETISHSL